MSEIKQEAITPQEVDRVRLINERNENHIETCEETRLVTSDTNARIQHSEETAIARHRESEDTLRNEHRATEDAAQSRHRETRDDSSISTTRLSNLAVKVASLSTLAISIVITLLWTWYVGRPAEVALGLVPHDTVSGKQMAAEHRDYVSMQEKLRVATAKAARLEGENKNLNWLWHSHNLYVALMEDDDTFLERDANEMNAWTFLQNHTTTIRREKFMQIALDGEHPNLREWLDTNAPEQIKKALRTPTRSQSYWRRSIIAERNSLRAELADKTAEYKNARLFMFALFWDSEEDFKQVRLEDLPRSWAAEYPRTIERLKEVGSTEVLPLLNTIDRALKRTPLANDQHPIGAE